MWFKIVQYCSKMFNVVQYCSFCPKNRAKLRKISGISKKMHFFCIFFRKYLVMSKKSSTFALAFEKEAAGCSSARLECLLWEQEVVSSNLAIPTNQNERMCQNIDTSSFVII